MKKKLNAKYIVMTAVILTFTILFISMFLFSRSTNRLLEDTTENYLLDNTRAVAAVFNTELNDKLVMLESQVRYFRDIDLTDYNAMKETILATKGIGAFKNIGVANTSGATINYNGKSSGNVMLTDYFKEAMKGNSAISANKYKDEDGDEVLVLAVPIDHGGKVTGMVFGTFTADTLNEIIGSLVSGDNRASVLIDDDGTVLARTDPTPFIHQNSRNFRDIVGTETLDLSVETVYNYKDGANEMLAIITPVGLHNWEFVTLIPKTVISDMSTTIAMNVFLVVFSVSLAFLILILSMIMLFRQIRRMTVEKERLGAELGVATKIQADMLPYDFPERDDISLYATMTPAKEVGGDFYDFFFADKDCLVMVMADVAGKGVPAAMFMTVAKMMIRNVTMSALKGGMFGRTPADILAQVNDLLCENNNAGLFVTVWLGILDLASGELTFANAGHEYPAFGRVNEDFRLLTGDNCPPLAAMEGLEYENETIRLDPGDGVFLYTDGVPEAKSESGERFGTDRMLGILNTHRSEGLVGTLTDMKKEIDDFTGNMDPFDDVTMMGIKYNGKG